MEDKTLSEIVADIKIRKNIVNIPGYVPVKIDIEIEKLADVVAKKISWLWKDRIAFGKMTLFAGEPGVGKSQLLLYIASVLSNGGKFHLDSAICEPSNVLLISGEDNSEDTLKPRLVALGANLDRIHNVKGIKRIDKNGHAYYDAICLVENIAELEQKIIENKYKLIIIDPISVYLGSVDENKNKEIRAALSVLTALAERHNLALVLNSHFSKPSGSGSKNAIYRVMGSIGFAAAARIVFGIMKDPEDPERRLFIPIKNNIGDDKIGYVYKIKSTIVQEEIATSRIEWLNETIDKTANELMNTQVAQAPKLDEVKQFLNDMLKNGSIPLRDIREKAEQFGYSMNRLYKAKNELKIYENESFSGRRGKIWSLPPV